ncbi:ABC transporter ATP-binding protein [Agrococcus sp. ARC_14]|uniref:ABC transporter ATP-binding protein n=1 Tax=Agrococcus sp. ARC_14 TaxID=2919927 RepID=UPI001F054AC8|nr:ABC transporter ATP-binding protein [Agrococcus sp. ARC_14]MCH1882333.1 ABC transporter ATP-binding protein [Agrococcus sp. ARC_14]
MSENAVEVRDVSKTFRVYHDRNQSIKATVLKGGRAKYEEFWALRDVSLDVPKGETFGLLGLNGSGKSTLLKCIAGILKPNAGSITTRGRMAAMLEVGSGFHPELSGRENIYLNGAILGMSDSEIDRKLDAIIDFAGVERFIDHPVKNYSSGMYVRLGFSVAIHTEPDLMLVDEVLSVGDKDFQAKCLAKFDDLKSEGKTVVVVSHSMGTMRTFCDQVAWLEDGELQAVGPASQVVDRYTGSGLEILELEGGIKRFGSGEVRFTDIEVLSPDGRHLESVDPTRPIVVRLSFFAETAVERPNFAVSIRDSQRVNVFVISGQDRDWIPERLEPGHGSVEIHMSSLPVRAGGYSLIADVRTKGAEVPSDNVRGAARFTVDRGDHSTSGGTLYLPSGFESLRIGESVATGTMRLMPD